MGIPLYPPCPLLLSSTWWSERLRCRGLAGPTESARKDSVPYPKRCFGMIIIQSPSAVLPRVLRVLAVLLGYDRTTVALCCGCKRKRHPGQSPREAHIVFPGLQTDVYMVIGPGRDFKHTESERLMEFVLSGGYIICFSTYANSFPGRDCEKRRGFPERSLLRIAGRFRPSICAHASN